MEVGAELPVESSRASRADGAPAIEVRLLGPLTISRGGVRLALPASRKVRALFAYLALAPHAVTRSQLCDLLWDVADDPRGELRWCLSKIRGLVDEPARRRVQTESDTVRLDLADCLVDAIEVARAVQEDIEAVDAGRLRTLAAMFAGDVLEGLEIDRSPAFNSWLIAQRRRFRGCRAVLLERLVGRVGDDEAVKYLAEWLELAPFDQRVHEILLNALSRRGRMREGEEHLAATARLFEAEGLDHAPIRALWQAARGQADNAPRVQAVAPVPAPESSSGHAGAGTVARRRASIAVMPFVDRNPATGIGGGAADGLAHDVITRLAKLRTLLVIAQGTVFALHERCIGPEAAGRMLNVDYVVGGSLHRQGKRLAVTVELAEAHTAHIVWAEVFNLKLDDTFLVLDEIGNRIVASIASEIEMIERNRAILKPPSSLDAWEAHHRGLWHMYRFNQAENERARHFFEAAVRLDPTFARAFAGLSFTHFQSAFQGWGRREPEIDRAFETAGQSLMVDDRDPAAHWAMGRALWLRGRQDQSIIELEQAIDISPNFALGHYMLAFVHARGGDPHAAIASSDHSRHLSPFDPLLFGMLASRAMALARLQRFDEAAEWGMKAASRPNAHAHSLAIAAFCLALAGRLDGARAHMAAVYAARPDYRIDDLFTAMQFAREDQKLFRHGAKRIGVE